MAQRQLITKDDVGEMPPEIISGLPAVVPDWGGDEGGGFEAPRPEEQRTPFLWLLQGGSPMCKEEDAAFDPRAKPGMMFDTALIRLYDVREKTGGGRNQAEPQPGDPPRGPVEVVPVFRKYIYVEREPFPGDFKGILSPEDERVQRYLEEQGPRKKLVTTEGTELVETFEIYVLYGPPGFTRANARRAIVSFSSTKIPVYQTFFEQGKDILYGGKNPPMWAHRWHIWSHYETHRKSGPSWNYRMAIADLKALDGVYPNKALLLNTDPLFLTASEFRDQIKGGKATADYAKQQEGSDIPF